MSRSSQRQEIKRRTPPDLQTIPTMKRQSERHTYMNAEKPLNPDEDPRNADWLKKRGTPIKPKPKPKN